MDDFISRQEAISRLSEVLSSEGEFTRAKEAILEAPTAYNVDKVCEQLDANAQKMSEAKAIRPYAKCSPADHRYYKAISVKKAKDIVKAGGVNETNA